LTVPISRASSRASNPPPMAPALAPAPIRPNSRRAWRASNTELAKVQACTGTTTPKQLTQT
jgi:hypothetical protein